MSTIDDLIRGQTPHESTEKLLAPFTYLQLIPGNNSGIRNKFLVGFNTAYVGCEDHDVVREIGEIIELFHAASLLIDDIEDDSTIRRGKTCAHHIYGVPTTLNCGNLMYFVTIQRAIESLLALWAKLHDASDASLMKTQMTEIIMEEMLNLHKGQGLEIYWRDNLEHIWRSGLPTLDDYMKMTMHKTGGLFRLSVRLLGLFTPPTSDAGSKMSSVMVPLANLFGIIYQIRDDYLNLVDARYSKMKGVAGEDLIEGKLSLPILYSLLNSTDTAPLRAVLLELKSPAERRVCEDKVQRAAKHLQATGAMDFTYNLLQEYVEHARLLMSPASGNARLSDILSYMANVARPSE